MIQLFDIKTRTLGFAFCQPPKKSLPKSLTQKKSLQNFKPKKGLRTSPSFIYLSTPPGHTKLASLLALSVIHFHNLPVCYHHAPESCDYGSVISAIHIGQIICDSAVTILPFSHHSSALGWMSSKLTYKEIFYMRKFCRSLSPWSTKCM